MSKMQHLPITIKTLSPVIVSTKSSSSTMTASHDYFSGSIVRGIVAGEYITARNLGKSAEQDEDFVELFFSSLRFVAAYPVVAGNQAMVLPLSLQKSKDGYVVKNLLTDEPEAGYKSLKGLGIVKDGKVELVTVRKKITLHMSRSNGRNQDSDERLAGRSLAGGIFNYESIDAGQEFCGYIIGEAESITKLKNVLPQNTWQTNIGRSRYTQYGKCQITLGEAIDIENNIVPDAEARVYLRLETPLLNENPDDVISALQEIPVCMNELTAGGFSLGIQGKNVFSQQETVDNFVGAWNLKRPRELAVAAGTIFCLQKNSPWNDVDKAALLKIMYEGIGWRCYEGFGQLRVWNNQKLQLAVEKKAISSTSRRIENPIVRQKALMIMKKRVIAVVQNFAADDAWTAKKFLGEGSAHFLSRLDKILHNAKLHGGLESLQAELSGEVKGSASPFAKTLATIRIHGKNLKSILGESTTYEQMPYWQEERYASVASEQMQNILRDLQVEEGMSFFRDSTEIFYAYWHWFCRYSRKYAHRTEC